MEKFPGEVQKLSFLNQHYLPMSAITLFEEKHVRRAWNATEEKWYFAIDDVVEILTGSVNVKDYIKKLRKRDPDLNSYWGTNCPPVEMRAADGKWRKIRAAHTEGLLRIIQSIPSPKAEPFKRWLATNDWRKSKTRSLRPGGCG